MQQPITTYLDSTALSYQILPQETWANSLIHPSGIGILPIPNFSEVVQANSGAEKNDLGAALKIIRRSVQMDKTGHIPETPIYYHVYYSDVFGKPGYPPFRGIIITAYGAGINIPFGPNFFDRETYLASQGYVVYVLKVRGTRGYGTQFVNAQGNSKGILSVARDVAYFASLLRNQLPDIYGNKLAKSVAVKGLPMYFEGTSFGGYLALFMATCNDTVLVENVGSVPINEAMDGYIALAPLSDIRLDGLSHTRAGTDRYNGYSAGPSNLQTFEPRGWLANFIGNLDPLKNDQDNQILSPLYHTQNIKRPVLLLHGLQDTNTSPRQSLAFFNAANQTGTAQYITLNFPLFLSHDWTPNANYYFARSMLRFVESVTRLQLSGIQPHYIYNSPEETVANTKRIDAANFIMRGINPDIKYANYVFIVKVIQDFPAGSLSPNLGNDLLVRARTKMPDLFFKALIAKKEQDRFSKELNQDPKTFDINTLPPQQADILKSRETDAFTSLLLNRINTVGYEKFLKSKVPPILGQPDSGRTFLDAILEYFGGTQAYDNAERYLLGFIKYYLNQDIYKSYLVVEAVNHYHEVSSAIILNIRYPKAIQQELPAMAQKKK